MPSATFRQVLNPRFFDVLDMISKLDSSESVHLFASDAVNAVLRDLRPLRLGSALK